ncbi:DUF4350 domain-containing protein [Marinobacterium weihaiense]|uniref:DUF4350 domain-containing protein n=1 Tax=Marinobacterium weihaiense TaxID=2851016 RepID=A0ABS6M8W3_9GAMM|nr:DUF4350 domain-containing protein [Marinobacterium weihaiense]MBV0932336.1 DUF4350 domain-containing protein [Marinobacterium weihaiense]
MMRLFMFRVLPLAALVLLVLLGYVLMNGLETVGRVVDRGPSVEVRRNQYLAAGQLLEQQGQRVVHSRYPVAVDQLGPRDSLLLTDADYLMDDPVRVAALLEWVESGGHLLWHYSPTQTSHPLAQALGVSRRHHAEDKQAHRDKASRTADEEVDVEALLEHLEAAEKHTEDTPELRPSERVRENIHRKEAGVAPSELNYLAAADRARFYSFASSALEWQSDTSISANLTLEARSQPSERAALLMLRLGSGRVTVLQDIGIWSNSRIGLFDHAYLLLWLNRDHPVVHVQRYSDWPPLSQLLVAYAPEMLVIDLCLLLAWLLYRGRRFGPVLQPSHQQRRTLNEHIDAVARFHYRQGHLNHLLAPLRRQVLNRAARLQVGLEQLTTAQQQAAVAEQAQLPATAVSQAMTPQEHYTSAELVETVQLLLRIRNRL